MKVIWALVGALLLSGVTTGAGLAATRGNTAPGTDASAAQPVVQYADAVAPHGFFWQLLTPQTVVPGSFLYALPPARKRVAKGTRSDEQFFQISSTGTNDVPDAALRAYKHAATVMASTDPGCRISWTFLAAIGRVESNHGRFGGSQLGSDGVSRPAIVGPRLDGAGPFAAIPDSDGGKLDGDTTWDRAIGQMQFLPGTWRSVARDGDGDGVANPGDIDDSALGAAVYLCGSGGDLSTDAGRAQAAFRYNHSDYSVALVQSFAKGYQTGVFVAPTPPPPPGQDNVAAAAPQAPVEEKKKASTAKPSSTPTTGSTGSTGSTPSATPKPSASPKPGGGSTPSTSTPSPTPSTPSPSVDPTPQLDLVPLAGTWAACDGGWCVDGQRLDLGENDRAGQQAAADYDGSGGAQTNGEEWAGLVGQTVTLQVAKGTGMVYVIGGKDYRGADGSFR